MNIDFQKILIDSAIIQDSIHWNDNVKLGHEAYQKQLTQK
jgi:hypothetical protein